MTLAQGILLGVGAVLEFVGIVVLAAPDLLPYRDRLSRWLAPRVRRVINRVRRLLRLSPLRTVVSLGTAMEANAALSIDAVKQPGQYATLEEKVAFLLRRDLEAKEAANNVTARVRDLEADLPKRLDTLAGELREHVASEVTAAQDQHRQLRVLGALALALGLACTTVANFA